MAPKTITLTLKLTDSYTDKFGRVFTIADYLTDLAKVDDEGEPKESPQETLTRLLHKGGSREFTLGRDNARKASGKPAARLYAPDLSQVADKAVPAALVARVEAFRAEVKPAPEPQPAKPAKPAKVSAKDRKIAENEARIKELEAKFAALQAAPEPQPAKPAPKITPITPVLSGKDPQVSQKIATARKAAKAAKKEEAAKAAGTPVIHRTDLTPATVATAPAIVPVKPAAKLPVTRRAVKDPTPVTTTPPAGKKVEVTASGLVLESFDL